MTTIAPSPAVAGGGPTSAPAVVESYPRIGETRARADLPVAKVTLLEDRAQVRREGRLSLEPGVHRLVVRDVAPVLQDVSLRAEVASGAARVADARARRAMRVGVRERPEAAAALEEELRALERRHRELVDEATRAEQRYAQLVDMMAKAAAEIPEDAAWSLGHPQLWSESFDALGKRARAFLAEAEATAKRAAGIAERRAVLDRRDVDVYAVVELDVVVSAGGEVALALEYSVPNALWRPFHQARLVETEAGARVLISSSAAVWQNTGEDWNDAELVFSTARSSLGVEPPKLRDDLLSAKKKSEQVTVAAREVAIQKAGLGRPDAPRPAGSVELPGVDDGGEIRSLKAAGRATVPSDGRPVILPVFRFESEAEATLVAMPELDERAFHRARATHAGAAPLLAGPVELVRASGFVGFTRVLFTAPGERFQLGFGPDADVRVRRTADVEEEVDPVDGWTRRTHTVLVFLSNLSGHEKHLEVTERIPVSEIEHVRIALVADKTTGEPSVDGDGLVTWRTVLPGNGRTKLSLVFRVDLAPGVKAV